MAGNQVIILSGFLEECYKCHKLVHFSCTYQSMQSYPIITPNLSFSSPTTLVQHSSFPPQKAIWINLGPLFLSDPCQWVI